MHYKRFEVDDFYPSRVTYLTASGIVFPTRGILHGIVVTAIGGASGATIYAGANDKAEIAYAIKVASGETETISISEPIFFEQGLFVAIDNSNGRASIQHSPVIGRLEG